MHDLESAVTQLPMQPPSNVILTNIEEANLSSDSPQAELLRWHYRLGHCLFTRIRILEALCVIPRKLLQVKSPKCAECLYGTMTKCPSRTKSLKKQGSTREDYSPEE